MTTANTATLDIGNDLTISRLAALYIQSLRFLTDDQSIIVEIGDISFVDTAGVQFLLGLYKAASQSKQTLQFSGSSDVLSERIQRLGLQEKLPV